MCHQQWAKGYLLTYSVSICLAYYRLIGSWSLYNGAFIFFISVPPNVTTNNNMFGVFEMSSVTVECYVESSPRPVSYWIKEASGKHSNQNDNSHKQKIIQQR